MIVITYNKQRAGGLATLYYLSKVKVDLDDSDIKEVNGEEPTLVILDAEGHNVALLPSNIGHDVQDVLEKKIRANNPKVIQLVSNSSAVIVPQAVMQYDSSL